MAAAPGVCCYLFVLVCEIEFLAVIVRIRHTFQLGKGLLGQRPHIPVHTRHGCGDLAYRPASVCVVVHTDQIFFFHGKVHHSSYLQFIFLGSGRRLFRAGGLFAVGKLLADRWPGLANTHITALIFVNHGIYPVSVFYAGKAQGLNLNMDFKAFWEIYRNDMKERLRENTMRSKDYIVELKILPYFGNRNISEISAADIREWQNTLLKKGYSQTYLRTVNNQLSCIFNYAVKYYDLPRNPCRQAGTIGKSKADEMNFWTQDEFEQFISCMEDKPTSHCGFMILYWTGCRIGELLALTLEDFNEEEKTYTVNS